jgi:Zn-dependent oligopeptidase
MSSSLVPPQPPVKWDHSPESIRTTTKEAIDASRTRQDQIAVLEPSKASFQTVFQALAFSDAKLDLIMEPITFYQNVSPSKELRDASNEAENLIREFEIESTMRVDVYTMLQKAEENIKANGEYDKLSPEEKRLIEKTLLDGKRAGLALPEKEREEVKAVGANATPTGKFNISDSRHVCSSRKS